MVLYVLTVLQTPVLEIAHVLSHMLIDHDHHERHTLADHKTQQSHLVLFDLAQDQENQSDQHHSVKKPTFNPEILNEPPSFLVRSSVNLLAGQLCLQDFKEVSIDIIPPPPRTTT